MRYNSSFVVAVLVSLFVLVATRYADGQHLQPGQWKTYTSMRSVSDLAAAPDSAHIWVATSGGAFRFNPLNPSEADLSLRNTDGLTDNDINSIAVDSDGVVYLGGRFGSFDVYNSNTK